MELNSRQRAQLRGLANTLTPIFQIGKEGIGPHLAQQVDLALEARELIKFSVLETAPLSCKEAADMLAPRVRASVVQCIGRKFVLYRESEENKKIQLLK